MKILTLLVAGAFLGVGTLTTAAHPLALADGETVTVKLVLDASQYPSATLAGTKTCIVTVHAGDVLADALDQATLDGCFAGWTWTTCVSCITQDLGRMLTGVDGRVSDNCYAWPTWLAGIDPPACTWYTILENDQFAPRGVDHLALQDGFTYTFAYNAFLAPTLP